MNIAIDATPLKTEHKYRGIGFYTANLIKALEKYDNENLYTRLTQIQNVSKNIDLVHYPYLDLFARTLKVSKNVKTVVTVHDLTPIKFSQHFPPGVKGKINWFLQKKALARVDAVIADSYCSKKDIQNLTGISKKKIYVVYLAPSQEFRKLETRLPAGQVGNWKLEIKQKYQLPDIFVLYVGDVNWNKNVLGLIEAFKKLKAQNSKRKATAKILKLVMVGKAFLEKGLKEVEEIDNLIKKLNLETEVKRLGFVPTKDLMGIYNLAKVCVQPSFYEGFGLPCLEAMACGCPVVAGNTAALKEICGKAVIYVNPHDAADIASGIVKILKSDSSNYQTLVRRELSHVKKFSWRKVAEETIRVYEKVLES